MPRPQLGAVRYAWLFVAVLGFGACGKGAPTPPGTVVPFDTVALTPAPGWPSAVVARSVPRTFRSSITGLDVDATGKVWLLRDQYDAPGQVVPTPVLERYAPDGPLERRVTFSEHARVTGFVVHPSGTLSAFVLRDDDGDTLAYQLHLVRLSHEGAVLDDVAFTELPGPRENLFYDDSGVHELPADRPFTLALGGHAVGLADGEGLFVLAEWSYTDKLYRIDARYRLVWGAQVFPAHVGNAFRFMPSLLARDAGGAIYAGFQLFADDAHVFSDHFGRPALTPLGTYDTLVQRFASDGTFVAARLFGGPDVDDPSAMLVRDDTVLVGGAARIVKHDQPNRTMEWDLALSRGAVGPGGALPEQRSLDLSRDDFGWALAAGPDGGLILGGRTDYVQVDTNSEVENGKGLLLALGPDLVPRGTLTLIGPRDVQVRAIRVLPDGRVLLAGIRDGPLTHTDPTMTNNDGFWGIARLP